MDTDIARIPDRATGTLPLWQSGIAAILLAAVANAIVYAVARALDTIPQSVLVETPGGGTDPISLLPVVAASAQGGLGATLLYWLLRRFTSRPARWLVIVGGAIMVLSFLQPLSISEAPAKMVITLVIMHIVAAVVSIGAVVRLTRP